jgi:hypothetical protein
MTGHLAYMVTGIGTAVGNHLWQSTVFAVSAWLIALQLRRNRAHVRYGIWLAASVKFLIPFSLLIDLGGFLRKPKHAPPSLQTTLSSVMGCCRSAVLRFAVSHHECADHPRAFSCVAA